MSGEFNRLGFPEIMTEAELMRFLRILSPRKTLSSLSLQDLRELVTRP